MAQVIELPKPLQNAADEAVIKQSITDWSKIVAWTWANYLAFGETEQGQEQKLKNFFIQTLQAQATDTYASKYGFTDRLPFAIQQSLVITKLLLGDNDKIPTWPEGKEVTVTIPEVFTKLVGQQPGCLTSMDCLTRFHIDVITDQYFGRIREISVEEKDMICRELEGDDLRYIERLGYVIELAYPPRPEFGPLTVTEDLLVEWMTNSSGYLPPSPYIPVCGL